MNIGLKNIYTALVSDPRFSEILTGSVWALGARIIGTGLGLAASVIVARLYGAEMVGILAVIQSFMMFATIITVMGTNTSILRLIPEHVANYSITSAFKVYRKTQYFVGAVSLLAGLLLYFLADIIALKIFSKPHLAFYLAVSACFVLFRSFIDLNAQAIRGLRLIKEFAWMQVLPSAAFLLLLIVISLIYGGKNSPVYSQLASWMIAALVGVWIMERAFKQRIGKDDRIQSMTMVEILHISTPMLMTASMQFVIGQTGVILLGMFRSEAEVGYYAVAVKLATLTTFVLNAINSMAAPKFSELYHSGRTNDLFYVAQRSTRLIFWTTTPILIGLLAFGCQILRSLFGEDFTKAYAAMAVLVIGQFINSISGSTGYFMQMTGHQKSHRNVMLVAGFFNILLGMIMVPRFGIVGAAFAGMVCVAYWNIYTLFFMQKHFHKTIGYFPLLLNSRAF